MPPSFDVDETRRLAYKLLIAVPWSRPPRDSPGAAAAGPTYAALGALFDALNVRPQRIRDLVLLWLRWSEAHLTSLARAWQRALIAAGLTVPTVSPRRG